MASAAKVALMLMLVSAMVMAAQAGSKEVTCKNDYCEPITLNGEEVEVGATVTITVDEAVREIVCEVTNAKGNLVSGTYTCAPSVTSLVFEGTADGLVVDVENSIAVIIKAAANDLIICVE